MKRINIKKTFENIILILITLIMFANANIISQNLRYILLLMYVLIFTYLIFFNNKKQINKMIYVLGLTIVFLIIHSFFSYSIMNSYQLLKYYVLFYAFLFVDFNEKNIYSFFKIVKKIIVFGAITIIVSTMIDNFVLKYLSFFVKANPVRIMGELSENTYSGIFSEKGNAAFLLNVGVALIGSKFLSNSFKSSGEKKLNIIELFIVFIALILTNKRALLAFPLIIFGFIYVLLKDKNKVYKIFKFAIPSLVIFIILIHFFPVMGTVFDRFINDDDNHRGELRAVCIKMNKEKPLLGYGINTYNQYAYDVGFRLKIYGTGDTDSRWRYHAHNIYYQLSGEVGWIGLIIIVFTFTYSIYHTIKLLRRCNDVEQKRNVIFILYIQMLFVLYGYTGNTFYYYQQIAIYFISINFLFQELKKENQMKGKISNEENRNNNISFSS